MLIWVSDIKFSGSAWGEKSSIKEYSLKLN